MDTVRQNATDQIELLISLQDYLQLQWLPKVLRLSILQRTTILPMMER
nr:MAG TPA: hypothetical protein [Caudoviricetes sp.]DAH97202.1 MAG TPA: hypothetical protein [Bacteriophage sp.]